ncbi:kinase-like domain-containing protein [Aspergillus filifer]
MADPVRQVIDIAPLEKYIGDHVPEVKTPLDVKQALTTFTSDASSTALTLGKRYALRMKPPGTLLPKTAHQVERDYRILHALRGTGVPVSKLYVLCGHEEVIGTAFYIMEFLDGRVFTDSGMPGVTPEERGEMRRSAIQTLINLHTLPYTNLAPNKANTLDIKTNKPIGPLPHLEEMASFFNTPSTKPPSRTLVHSDYKTDNIIFHKSEPRVIGGLYWEMATLGHPLSDIVSLIAPLSISSPPLMFHGWISSYIVHKI